MKFSKNIIYIFFIQFLLICWPLLASDQNQTMDEIKKILTPHKEFYTQKNLMELLNVPSTQVKGVKFLFNSVMIDKDYLAAEALLALATLNPEVQKFVSGEENQKYINKALGIKNLIDNEKEKIEKSITEVLNIIENSQIETIRKAKAWLNKPLPIDRIKCCVHQLLVNNDINEEIEKIILIFSKTNFGKQEIKKAREKLY